MQNEILNLVRPEIIKMSAYASARSENAKGNIWLDANENSSTDTAYNRYPEPQPYLLVEKLAALYNVNPKQILVTRGSDEGIDLLVRLFCRAGSDQIMICPPTYGMYKVAATIQNATVIEVPLIKELDFSLNLENIFTIWTANIKLIFLCSPNNPTGNLLSIKDIISICQKYDNQSIIIIDEAYIEFSMQDSLVKYLSDFPNLVVLRTLSKAYGLAGIRCGVTIANQAIIEILKKIIAPYPIPTPILNIALEKLDFRKVKEQTNIITQERKKLFDFLSTQNFVKKVWKSDANFLLLEAENPQLVMKTCSNNGIVLRDRSNDYNLNNCLRITIGSPAENTFLMEVLSRV